MEGTDVSLPKIASLNIDVDPLVSYYEIYGVNQKLSSDDPLYLKAIPRFLKFLKRLDIKSTFFITARSFSENTISMLKEIKREGHEIASHSFSHDYHLILNSHEKIKKDIEENFSFLQNAADENPIGFRAPGYNISKELLTILRQAGYRYDSSLLHSRTYLYGKAFFIALQKIIGKETASVIYKNPDLDYTYKPYRIRKTKKTNDNNAELIEFPITSVFSIPFIGTSIILLPRFILKFLISQLQRREFINIELHIIDFADATDSHLFEPILKIHPGLRIPSSKKEESISYVVTALKQKGYSFKTLAECTELF
ncbi:MAG: hypothetical protein D6734_00260 [Candidatus Schekmanbacteria bacterium]|nr:MAG: hypothetical protein D6734_00260 [Candidatus Schekmanbacteria bacterium]